MTSTAQTHAQASAKLLETTPASARSALRLLRQLKHGTLQLRLPTGETCQFGSGQAPHATLYLRNWSVCTQALKSGDIGFAETFIAGDWSSPNLVALLNLFIVNRKEIEAVIYGTWWGRLAYRIQHLLNRNSKTNSQKNIHTHYDLGNSFYALWLDGSMNYSAGLFDGNTAQSMSDAQDAKVRRALRMAQVTRGSRVLEIGCGWGALAQKAVEECGAHITGVTLSAEQLTWAQNRMQAAGVLGQSDLRLQDYRDIQDGPYDAVCSIEMVEAVGQAYWPDYFSTVARLLKPGGMACIQTIVIDDALFDRYVRSTDFIQQYVFPGGCLPSPSAFKQAASAAGLQVVDEFKFGQDYAETLRRWRAAFLRCEEQVLALAPRSSGAVTQAKRFDPTFVRTWEFYLAYCEAAFSQSNTDVIQFTLRKL